VTVDYDALASKYGGKDEGVDYDALASKYGGKDEAKPDKVLEVMNRRPTAGIIDAGLSLGSAALAGPVSGIAGIAGAALPGPQGQGADMVRKVQEAMTYEPRTELGKGINKAVSYPFQKLGEAADVAGAASASKTGSPAFGAGVNTALQSLPLVLGRAAPVVGEPAAAVAKRNAMKRANEQYDAGTVKAREAGYVVPPTQANPSLLNQLVEGIAGKVKTAQSASIKNQEVTNGLVRKALGIADDAPLNVDSLQKVRKEAGAAYERVRSAGDVVADETFGKALDSIAEPYLRAAKDFPKAAKTEILDTIEAVRVPSFDAGSAIDQIGILRKDADKAFIGGDKQLGGTYKAIANALEEQLGRHLESSGAPVAVLRDFQRARETIAKSYTVQKHLKPDGNVDAVGLGRELKRKPLTEELKTAAEFGEQFPKAAQKPERVGGVPMSLFDIGIGGGAAALLHNPMGSVAAAARPAVRSGILSRFYQDAMAKPPGYGPNPVRRFLMDGGEMQRNPLVPITEMSEGQQK
jgi:hypothetical protein